MGKGAKTSSYTPPPDPDPTPMVQSNSSEASQQAKREEQKRIAGQKGRRSTTIAGNTAQTEQDKKTILGG